MTAPTVPAAPARASTTWTSATRDAADGTPAEADVAVNADEGAAGDAAELDPAVAAELAAERTARRTAATADAHARAGLFSRLSCAAAAERDPRVAVGAAWAADVHHVQALLWERAPADDQLAHRRFLAVATAVGAAVCAATDPAAAPARDAREVVVTARRRLLSVFDGPAAALVADRLPALDHLAEMPAPDPVALPCPHGSLWWRDRDCLTGSLPAELRQSAADARVIAEALLGAGYRRDAAKQVARADVAEVEAYLVEASVAVGDEDLLMADVRRAAVVLVLSEAAEQPADVAAARAAVWAAVGAALAPSELARLAPRLGRVDSSALLLTQS